MRTETRSGGRRWLNRVGFVLPLALVWIVPIVVLVVVAPLSSKAERADLAPQVPEAVSVGSRLTAVERPVTISVSFADPVDVVVRRSGVVTFLNSAPGNSITEGAALVSIDGVPVIAYAGAAPLFRDLGRGDKGPDVQELGAFLARLGLMPASGVDQRFGPATEAGVRRFEAEVLGVAPTGRFSVGYVAFVPAAALTTKSVPIAVGQDFVAGTVAMTLSGPPMSVAITSQEPGNPPIVSGAITLVVGTDSIDLTALPAPAADAERIYALLSHGLATGGVTLVQPTTAGGGGEANSRGGANEVFNGAHLKEAVAGEIGTVPATAVWTNTSGASCVFVVDSGT